MLKLFTPIFLLLLYVATVLSCKNLFNCNFADCVSLIDQCSPSLNKTLSMKLHAKEVKSCPLNITETFINIKQATVDPCCQSLANLFINATASWRHYPIVSNMSSAIRHCSHNISSAFCRKGACRYGTRLLCYGRACTDLVGMNSTNYRKCFSDFLTYVNRRKGAPTKQLLEIYFKTCRSNEAMDICVQRFVTFCFVEKPKEGILYCINLLQSVCRRRPRDPEGHALCIRGLREEVSQEIINLCGSPSHLQDCVSGMGCGQGAVSLI